MRLAIIIEIPFTLYPQMFFEDNIDDAKYCGHLYGLGTSFVQNGTNNSEQANSNYSAAPPNSHPTANNGDTGSMTPTTTTASS